MTKTLQRIQAETAAEVCGNLELEDGARELLRDELSPAEYLDLLVGQERFTDAIQFLAAALPKREAVWWGYLCAQDQASGAAPEITAALEAVHLWVVDPTDEHRRAAMDAAETADLATPAGCAGMAAFFSEGSITPPGEPEAPPPEQITAVAVSACVSMSAVMDDPEKAPEKYRGFIELGISVASGENNWESSGTNE